MKRDRNKEEGDEVKTLNRNEETKKKEDYY